MNKPVAASERSLARNTILNFLGQFIPLLVGIITTPLIIQGLGTQRFGILSLAWVVIGYFSLFDLGLGRATTKYVSEFIGHQEAEKLSSLFWTSLLFNALLGIGGGMVMAAATPYLINHIFNIPPELLREARTTLLLLSASLPVVIITAALRGVLEGGQRFALVNAVKIPSSSLTFLISALSLPFGFRLPEVVSLLLIARIATMCVYALLCFKAFPMLKQPASINKKLVPSLLSFGGWITVSNIVAPLLVYLDRFFIGSLLSMDAVAFYTAPYEIVTRLWILPMSFVLTLFPVFSAIGKGRRDELGDLYARSSKYLLLIMGPLVLVIALFARPLLSVWLGAEFAQKSTLVLQVLCAGILINSLVNIPFTLIQGIGRPDITAKFHLLELPFYAVVAWLLTRRLGIAGAALAWSIRVTVDAILIIWASLKLIPTSSVCFVRRGFIRALVSFLGLVGASLLLVILVRNLFIQIAAMAMFLAIFFLGAWKYLISSAEKGTLHPGGHIRTLNLQNRR